MGFIYIMTNPCLENMVKIGYATDVEQRRKQLSTTALPYDYEIYATYETPGKLEDKRLHTLIDNLNPDLRVSKSREFFIMTPEDAYELLEAIAVISGSSSKLKKVKADPEIPAQKVRKPNIDFYKCELNDGDELVYTEDSSVIATVAGPHKVLYKEELTSLSSIVQSIKGVAAIQGPSYFTYKGEPLVDIANRTQWKNY